jgi:hypothetical protein
MASSKSNSMRRRLTAEELRYYTVLIGMGLGYERVKGDHILHPLAALRPPGRRTAGSQTGKAPRKDECV